MNRRTFPAELEKTGAVLAGGSWLSSIGYSQRVAPRALEAPAPGSRMAFKLPARSYSVAHIATS